MSTLEGWKPIGPKNETAKKLAIATANWVAAVKTRAKCKRALKAAWAACCYEYDGEEPIKPRGEPDICMFGGHDYYGPATGWIYAGHDDNPVGTCADTDPLIIEQHRAFLAFKSAQKLVKSTRNRLQRLAEKWSSQ